MAGDSGQPGPGGRRARGGASGRKRGTGRLTLVPDPVDEAPGESPVGPGPTGSGPAVAGFAGESSAVVGSALEEPGAPLGHEGHERAGSVADPDSQPGDEGLGGADPGSEDAARAICLRLLTSGPRTRAQLATALRKRKIPDRVAESVLSRFTEVGLIDDAAFARAWVESRHHSRGLARRALTAELRQRGIPDGEVRSAVGLLGPQEELATARRLVAKRVAATRGKPMPARARQLMGMLARKGYPAGLAAQAVREALEQEQQDAAGARADLAWISEDAAGDDWQ